MSLDKIYFNAKEKDKYLDCTRLEKYDSLVSRKSPNDKESVKNQIKEMSQNLKTANQTKIILVDDVVFSGNVLRKIIKQFQEYKIEVKGIRAAISTEEAYINFNKNLEKGIKCGCLLGKNVIDQICERDFYFGIAQSGISTMKENGKILKAPYFKPFGNPVERASIPKEYENIFSNNCLLRSMYLWKCMEDRSKKKIYIKDMPEEIINTNMESRILDTLRKGVIYNEKDANRDYGKCR